MKNNINNLNARYYVFFCSWSTVIAIFTFFSWTYGLWCLGNRAAEFEGLGPHTPYFQTRGLFTYLLLSLGFGVVMGCISFVPLLRKKVKNIKKVIQYRMLINTALLNFVIISLPIFYSMVINKNFWYESVNWQDMLSYFVFSILPGIPLLAIFLVVAWICSRLFTRNIRMVG